MKDIRASLSSSSSLSINQDASIVWEVHIQRPFSQSEKCWLQKISMTENVQHFEVKSYCKITHPFKIPEKPCPAFNRSWVLHSSVKVWMCKHCEISFYLVSVTQFNLKEDRLAGGHDQEVLTDHLHPWVSELDLHQNCHTFQHTLLDYVQIL